MRASNVQLRPTGLQLFLGEEHACPYLPGRAAQLMFALSPDIDAALYRELMDRGFRRSGEFLYRADCVGCRACMPIRVPVADFRPSRSQRRVLRRNRDVEVRIGRPVLDEERWDVYQRYQTAQHDGEMISTPEEYFDFLCTSPIDTLEMSYRVSGRLVGVGIVDSCPDALSSVYFYFDPHDRRRSLGTFSGLCEIELCRRRGLAFWYVGYYVRGCSKMDYKARFGPHEVLGPDGSWTQRERIGVAAS